MNKLLVLAGVIIGAVAGALFLKRSRRNARTKFEETKHRTEHETQFERAQDKSASRTSCSEEEALFEIELEDPPRQPTPPICETELIPEALEQQPAIGDIQTDVCRTDEECFKDGGRVEAEGLWKAFEAVEQERAGRSESEETIQRTEGQDPKSEWEPPRLLKSADYSAEPHEDAEQKNVSEVTMEHKWIDPEKRGGRPRVVQSRERVQKQEDSYLQLNPEIICYDSNRQWILALEVQESTLPSIDLNVNQNGSPLTEDQSGEGRWALSQAFGTIAVDSIGGQIVREIDLGEAGKNYLLFRLSGKRGRRVRQISAGAYLVIVPDNWTQSDIFYGSEQPLSLPGYRAYFCVIESSDERILFYTAESRSVIIQSKRSQFELVGTRLEDATEGVGPLFGKSPPKIRAIDKYAWKGVGKIVVGEEGAGLGRWRKAFYPASEDIEQELPREVSGKKAGWFFIRLYDTEDELLDSLDFRFARSLKGLTVFQSIPLPYKEGHRSARLQFLHDAGCRIQLADREASPLQINVESQETNVIIPPDPAFDQTYWDVKVSHATRVRVQMLVERVWWGIGKEHLSIPLEMSDKPVQVNRDDFVATSDAVLRIWFPKPRWANHVLLGFHESRQRRYQVEVNRRYVSIPLRELWSAEVEDRTQPAELNLWLDSMPNHGVVVCEISPETQVVSPPVKEPPVGIQDEVNVTSLDADQIQSCSTCDHAKRRPDRVFSFKCMRHHWATVSHEAFQEKYSRYACPEWQGEYYDAQGNYHSK